jgi:protein TonB
MEEGGFQQRRKLNWKLITAVAAGHVLALIGLTYAFAPDFTRKMVDVLDDSSLLIVGLRTDDDPKPPVEPAPDEGAAAEEGQQATPRETTAPEVPRPRDTPAPRASSTGSADASGASNAGTGTGGGGEGSGTGSGASGSGSGNAATRPSVRSGRIDAARDFPIPPGGREVRYGTSVTVVFTVNVDGTASDCSISSPGPDPATNALVCPLVLERIRFNPARDAAGNPVPARYGWRQDFTRR